MEKTTFFKLRVTLFMFIILGLFGLNAQTVNNGNFEAWTGGEPDSWTLTANFGTNITFNQAVGLGVTGDALEIIAEAYNAGADGQISTTVEDLTEGYYYNLSFNLKSNDDLILTRITNLVWLDASDNPIGAAIVENTFNENTGDEWTEFFFAQNPLLAPAGASKLQVNLVFFFAVGINAGTSAILIDDFVVEDVSADMAIMLAVDNTSLTNNPTEINVTYLDAAQFATTIVYPDFHPALNPAFLVDALIVSDKELDAGAIINIVHTGYGIDVDFVATGGETSLWLSEILGAPRAALIGHTGITDVWQIEVTGLIGGTYNITISSVADDDFGDTDNRYVLASDDVQIVVESAEDIAIQHAVDNTTLTNNPDVIDITYADAAEFATTIVYPEFQAALPINLLVDALIVSDKELDAGANINITHAGYGINEDYVAAGGETSLWLSEMLGVPRAALVGHSEITDVWNVSITGLVGGTYNITISSVTDDDFGDTDNRYVLASDIVQINVETEEEVALQHGIDNTVMSVDPLTQTINGTATASIDMEVSFASFMTAFPADLMFDILISFSGNEMPENATLTIISNSVELGEYVFTGGETSLWLFDLDNPDVLQRDYIKDYAVETSTVTFEFNGLDEEGTYTIDFDLVVDLETGFTSSVDWTIFADGQADIIIDNTVYAEFPLFEDFETEPYFFENGVSTVAWATNTVLKYDGNRSMHNAYTATNNNILKIIGPVNISSATAPTLTFWHIAKTENNFDHCYVEYSSDGLTWSRIPASKYLGSGSYVSPAYNTPEGPCFMSGSYSEWANTTPDNTWWKREKFSLEGLAAEDNLYLRFRLKSDGSVNQAGWYLDAISLYNETCPEPTNFVAADIMIDQADLTWTASGDTDLWQIKYSSVAGFNPNTQGTLLDAVTVSPITLNSLNSNTTYFAYIRSDCGDDDYSEWVGPIQFTTLIDCPAPINFAVETLEPTSVILEWEQLDGATEWTLVYGPQGFNYSFAGTVVNVTDDQFVEITGLDPETAYQVYIRANCGGTAGNSAMVGPVNFTTLELCPFPLNFAVDSKIDTEVTLSWQNSGGTSLWNIEYGEAGFVLGEGTLLNGITDNPYTITGLDPNTAYSVYIQSDCSGENSDWSPVLNFTTECSIITPEWLEDFSGTFPPECWGRFSGQLASPSTLSTSSLWFEDGFANVGTTGAAKMNIYSTNRFGWFITPAIDLGDGSTSYLLEFDLALTAFGSTNPAAQTGVDDKFAVVISTDNGATWSSANVLRMWDNEGSPFVYNQINTTGEHVMIDLSTYSGIVKLGFYGESTISNANNDLFVDNVAVNILPACVPPLSLNVSDVTDTEAEISWNTFGSESEWDILYGLTGFDPLTEGTEVFNITQNPYTLNTLSHSTSYDVYVRTVCGAETSTWTGPVSFTTDPACFAPINLSVAATTTISADIEWEESSDATEWEVLYGLTGFDPETEGTLVGELNLEEYSISGLTQNTTYDVYVRADCGVETSAWTGSVSFTTDPTCPAPSSFATTATTGTTASLEWEDVAGASTWEVIYGPVGFDPETEGNLESGINLEEYEITGLSPIATYHVYVRANCGVGDNSDWTGPLSFSTACGVVSPYWFEDFSGSFPPLCWARSMGIMSESSTLISTTAGWTADGFANNGFTGAARLNIWSTSSNYWLLTPTFDLGDGSTNYQLEFDLALTAYGSTNIANQTGVDDKFAVVISTDNGATWSSNNALKLWDNAGSPDVYNNISTTGEKIIIDLTAYTGEVIFGFYGESTVSNADNDLFVDNFTLKEIPTCQQPILFSAATINGSSVSLDWTEYGTATEWEVYYGETGFELGVDGTTETVNAEPPYVVAGLTPETEYEFYVRAVCDVADQSDWTGPVFATTDILCPAPQNITISDIEAEQVVVNWNEAGADLWDILYGDAGFDPDTEGTALNGVTGSPYTLSGLITDTSYELYLRVDCDADGVSEWTGPIVFTTLPSCPAPTNIQIATITENSANVSWTAGDTETQWVVYYGPQGFDPLSEGLSLGVASISTGLTSLTEGTTYDVYVQANCGGGDYSSLTGPVQFTTLLCNSADLCEFTFNLEDSYGDGWNGNSIDVVQNGVIVQNVTFTTGYSATVNVNLCDGVYTEIVFRTGSFISEVSFNIEAPWGDVIYNGSGFVSGDNNTVVFSWNAACNPPTCPQPTALTSTETGTSYIIVDWTDNSTATQWEVVYGEAGFDFDTEGTSEIVNAEPPYTISGLDLETEYDIFVRAICDVTDQSEWTGPITVSTTPSCFNITSASLEDATFESLIININTTGAETQWNIVYGLEDFIVGESTNALITENPFTITGLEPETSYDFYIQADCGALDGLSGFAGPFTFTTAEACPIITNVQISDVDYESATFTWDAGSIEAQWHVIYGEFGFDPSTEGTTISENTDNPLTISGLADETQYSVYIIADCGVTLGESDIVGPYSFTTTELCPDVTGLSIVSVTDFSISIDWNPGSIETTWFVEYGLAGFTAGTGTMETVTVTPEFEITGLLSNTEYDIYVMADCQAALGTSDWVQISVSTDCNIISDFTWLEDFSNWTGITDCWSLTGGTNVVTHYNTNSVMANFWNWSSGSTAYLTSPRFDISSLENPYIEFDWSHLYDASYPNDMIELQVTENNGADWTTVWSKTGTDFNSNDGATSTTPGSYISSGEIDLGGFGNEIKFRFYFYSGFGPNAFIDNVTIYDFVCAEPTNVVLDEVNALSATISWTDNTGQSLVNVIYGEQGFDPLSEGTTITNVVDNPYTLTNLEQNTDYDVFIVSICVAEGVTSSPVGPVSFTTDDFVCEDPTNIAIDDFTATTAIISWTDNSGTGIVNVVYGEPGFDPATEGTTIENVSENPYTITGLDANTVYDIYIVSDCDIELSNYVGPINFTTEAYSTATDILTFTFGALDFEPATIDNVEKEVHVIVLNGTNLTTLTAGFTLSDGANANIGGTAQNSGVTVNDFNTPLVYNVVAEDMTTNTDWTVYVSIASEISLSDNSIILVYPNPTNGEFKLDFRNVNSRLTYQVYDSKSSIIVEKQINAYNNTIEEISLDVLPGVYYIRITTDTETVIEKIVVE